MSLNPEHTYALMCVIKVNNLYTFQYQGSEHSPKLVMTTLLN